jgi:bla regulator protein blaR1
MASARRLYRLQVGLSALGIAATAMALTVALTRVDFDAASLDGIRRACRQMGLGDLSSASLLVQLLSSLAFAVTALAARSALSQRAARRRFLASVVVVGDAHVAGHETLVIDDARPQAFCTGLLRPRIYVSRGALAMLDSSQLDAVVAHEAHHACRRDPLRICIARILGDALFFLPVLRQVADRYAALAELAADEAAVRHSRTRQPLAAALLTFQEPTNASVVGIAPERVDHLLGKRPRWELPVALLAGAGVTLAGLFALALRTADAISEASVDMPVLLAQTCMVGMTVMPVLVGAAAVLGSKRALGRRRA